MEIFGRHQRYLKLAYALAKCANGVQKHGCVVVSGGRVLGKGWNDYDTYCHAEKSALDGNWKSEFRNSVLYVVRIRKAQMFGNSRPCDRCMARIKEYGVKRIIYSTDDIFEPFKMEKI